MCSLFARWNKGLRNLPISFRFLFGAVARKSMKHKRKPNCTICTPSGRVSAGATHQRSPVGKGDGELGAVDLSPGQKDEDVRRAKVRMSRLANRLSATRAQQKLRVQQSVARPQWPHQSCRRFHVVCCAKETDSGFSIQASHICSQQNGGLSRAAGSSHWSSSHVAARIVQRMAAPATSDTDLGSQGIISHFTLQRQF